MTSPALPRIARDLRQSRDRGPVLSFRQHKAGEVMAECPTAVWRNMALFPDIRDRAGRGEWGCRVNIRIPIFTLEATKRGERISVRIDQMTGMGP